MADYMLYALERGSTRVISLFLETVRDLEKFRLALETAAGRDAQPWRWKVGRRPRPAGWSRPTPARWPGRRRLRSPVRRVRRPAWTLNEMADLLSPRSGTPRRTRRPGRHPPTPAESGRNWSTPQQTSKFPSPGLPKRPQGRRRAAGQGPPAVNPLDAWGMDNDPAGHLCGTAQLSGR